MIDIITTCCMLASPLAEQQTPREYVIREVLPPKYHGPEYRFDYRATWFSGDHDQDGEADFLLQCQWDPKLGSPHLPEKYFEFWPARGEGNRRKIIDRQTTYDIQLGTWALLDTPTASQAMVRQGYPNGGFWSYNWDTGALNGMVPVPRGFPNGIPDPSGFMTTFNAGDQNGDGFEDFFWTSFLGTGSGFVYCGLVDGATWQPIWKWATQKSGGASVAYSTLPQQLQDIDGDGYLDFIILIRHDLVPASGSHTLLAFSGHDGSEIWNERDLGITFTHFAYGADLSGDGLRDFVFGQVDAQDALVWRALDSANGQELWETPLATLESLYPGQVVGGYNLHWRGIMPNLDNLTLPEFVVYHYVLPHFAGQDVPIYFAHYDGLDGSLIGSYPLPHSLEPWSPDSSFAQDTRGPFRIGDYDRDGIEEIAFPFKDWTRSPDWAINGSNPNPSTQLAIVGLRTLFVDEDYTLGSGPLDYALAIPAGAGKDFTILLSTVFDRDGGVELGPWTTFLGPSSMLDYTMAQRNISGTLDQDGKGNVSVTIPPHPSLLGQDLYARALVLNPQGSAEQIQTMSSLGITLLQ